MMFNQQMPKWMFQLMGGSDQDTPPEEYMSAPDYDSEDYARLRLKKKRQAAMLRQVMQEGGYGDLAKMTNIRGLGTSYADEGDY